MKRHGYAIGSDLQFRTVQAAHARAQRRRQRIRNGLVVILLVAALALIVWTAADADGPTLSPPEMPTAPAAVGGYPGPDPTAEPYPAPYPYPAPETFLPVLLESYP